MSKKSVSDVMQHRVVFPNANSAYISSRFEVRNHPVLVKAYGLDCDTIGAIEMGDQDDCAGWRWSHYTPECNQVAILNCNNAIAIGMPGWYRIVFRDRVDGTPSVALDDLRVTVTETDMPASMLAQFTGGSASMGCGSQVTIREQDGCFHIVVDRESYVICPGSIVTCDPNGFGVIIDGQLCAFPQLSASMENGCLTVVVNGQPFTVCDTNDVTVISALEGGVFRAVNPDGSVIEWDGENSVTIVNAFEGGIIQAINPDGSIVEWNGNDSITLISALDDGLFRAVNPDGSIVEWRSPVEIYFGDDFAGTGSPADQYTINWGRICAVATEVGETVAAHRVLMCRNGVLEKISPTDLIGEFCYNDVPDLGTVCGVGEQLVIFDDGAGCKKLGKVSEASYQRTTIGLYNVWGHQPVDTAGFTLLNDAVTPGLFYTAVDHTSDGGIDTAPYNGGQYGNALRTAPGLDESKVQNMIIGRWAGENACIRQFEGKVVLNPVAPAAVQDAYEQRGQVGRRTRYFEGGSWTPWLYRFSQGNGTLLVSAAINGALPEFSIDTGFTLYPGIFEVEYYYIAGANALNIRANTFTPGFAPQSPRVEISALIT